MFSVYRKWIERKLNRIQFKPKNNCYLCYTIIRERVWLILTILFILKLVASIKTQKHLYFILDKMRNDFSSLFITVECVRLCFYRIHRSTLVLYISPRNFSLFCVFKRWEFIGFKYGDLKRLSTTLDRITCLFIYYINR